MAKWVIVVVVFLLWLFSCECEMFRSLYWYSRWESVAVVLSDLQMGCSPLHQSGLKGVNHFETIEPKNLLHYNSCTNKIEIRKGFLIVLWMIDGLYISMDITFSRGQIQHNQTTLINNRHHMIYLLLYLTLEICAPYIELLFPINWNHVPKGEVGLSLAQKHTWEEVGHYQVYVF